MRSINDYNINENNEKKMNEMHDNNNNTRRIISKRI